MNKGLNIIPVILSGGTGTRLWPLSRKSFPKQYLDILKKYNFSLLQQTYKRLEGINGLHNPIIVCNTEHRFIVAEQFREINYYPKSIILEPSGKNTCPAITIASLEALSFQDDPILLILSADHEIKNREEFQEMIIKASKFAENGNIVTFGVPPTSPETGFGYIECGQGIDLLSADAKYIKKFIEKPNFELASSFLEDKKYLWNSGIFIAKAKVLINEIKKFSPQVYDPCIKTFKSKYSDLDFQRLPNREFEKCPNISFDLAVMEKTNLGIVLPLDAGWSDVGSWKSLWEISDKDSHGNVLKGKVILKESENCYLSSEERLIAGIGLNNLIIIETSDAILICDKRKSQVIKEIVPLLKKKGYEEGEIHKKVFRPWGSYTSIEEDSTWKIKKIIVNPHSSLSLQMHKYRSEHWIVVSGKAKVQIGNNVKNLVENESIYISSRTKHRLSNPGENPLILIEVQSGTYVGEDDIVRFEDNYGRKDKI